MSDDVKPDSGSGNTENRNPKLTGRYAHLKPWVKGQSGNPSGRPKGKPVTDAIKKWLDGSGAELLKKPGEIDVSKLTGYDLMAFQAIVHALKGRSAYFREIFGRLEGCVPLKIENGAQGDQKIDPALAAVAIRAMVKAKGQGPEPDEE